MRLNIVRDSTDTRNSIPISWLYKGPLGYVPFLGRNGNFLISCLTTDLEQCIKISMSSDLIALALVKARLEPGIAILSLAAS